MKVKTLCVLAGPLLVAGAANAGFTGVDLSVVGGDAVNGNGDGTYTVQAIARFENADDRIGAIAGIPGTPLAWSISGAGGGLINDDGMNAGGHNADLPFGAGTAGFAGPTDTWLTIGTAGGFAGPFPSFSPLFLGSDYDAVDNNIQVLVDGITSFSDEDSSYFFAGPSGVVGPLDGGWDDQANSVVIGQFTVAIGAGLGDLSRTMSFSGLAQVADAGMGDVQIGFGDTILLGMAVPAPGSLALLGLAGLIGRRRRRG